MLRLLIPGIVTAVVLQSAAAPEVYPSPRLAAIAFAVANGFDIPRVNLVAADEVETGMTRSELTPQLTPISGAGRDLRELDRISSSHPG